MSDMAGAVGVLVQVHHLPAGGGRVGVLPEAGQLESMAAYLEEHMEAGLYYAVGSGSTAKCISQRLGVDSADSGSRAKTADWIFTPAGIPSTGRDSPMAWQISRAVPSPPAKSSSRAPARFYTGT
mgnify:CR=1 FL=1